MIVVVDEHLFQEGQSRDTDLIALLRQIRLQGHGMLSSPQPKPRAKSSEPDPVLTWAERLRGRVSIEAQKLIAGSRTIPATTTIRGGTRVLVSDRWEERRGSLLLNLDSAIRVLGEPLHILVENGLRDAAFLRRILPEDWRSRFTDWEQHGRVRFEHGGGIDEMREIVTFMSSAATSESGWGIPAEAWRLVHYVIFDHDGDAATTPSKSSNMLEHVCRQNGLGERCHRLERRRQEYYLPAEAMRWIAERQLTDPIERQNALAAIQTFFRGDRRFDPLPNEGLWKSRFWEHRNDNWSDAWFQADGAVREAQKIAEDLERLL